MHGTFSDTGYACPPQSPLEPELERDIRAYVAAIRRERAAKIACVEWCWERSQQLTLEVMDDTCELSEWDHILLMRGAAND